MTAAEEFVDCSSNNGLPNIAAYMAAGHQWLSRKVTEGNGYHWTQGDALVPRVRAHGGRLVHYGWLRPDQTAKSQADYFVQCTAPHWRDGDRWMTDFELTYAMRYYRLPVRVRPHIEMINLPGGTLNAGGSLPETDAERAAQLEEFNAIVAKAFGRASGCVYTGNWYLEGKPKSTAVVKKWPVVMSDYDAIPDSQMPNPYGLDYIARQFSSTARVAGFSGAVDLNRWFHEPAEPDPLMEEIMSFYKTKAEFEKAVHDQAMQGTLDALASAKGKDALEAASPFPHLNVGYDGKRHTIEGLLVGNPDYVPTSKRGQQ